MAQTVDTHTVHTIRIGLEDQVISKIEAGDEVRVVFYSRAQSKDTTPVKLTWQSVERLTRDTF